MSTHDDIFAAASRPVLLTQFGATVTYTPAGAAAQAGLSLIPYRIADTPVFVRRGYRVSTATIAVPARGDVVTDSTGRFWTVFLAEDPEGGMVDLVCHEAIAVTYTTTALVATSIKVIAEHLPDLTPITQRSYLQRAFWVATGDVSPGRGDRITDADSRVWGIRDTQHEVDGLIRVQARIGQTRG